MNYLLYGTENFFINNEIKNIISNNNFNDFDISKYDLENNTINEIIEDANTLSLFSPKKLLIVYNSFIFCRAGTKKNDDLELLEEYLKSNNTSTNIIFVCPTEKIDNTKKTVKLLKSNGIIKEYNSSKNIEGTVKKMFDEYKIDSNTLNHFIKRVGNNLEIIYQEIQKLKLYKNENKIITIDDVNNICTESINVDVFKFIDNIINKNKKEAIKTYRELIKLNDEPIKLIALLASKFRIMFQASVLSKKGFTEDNISEILGAHKYSVHLAIVSGYKYNPSILLKYLDKLADLDIEIKTGIRDKQLALELFILSL